MIHPSSFSDRVRQVFQPTPRGVVGLVDDLLDVCRDQPLQLDFQNDLCRVRPVAADTPESIDVPLPKSVFRAVLARVAALCNERNPNSATPYRGEGELSSSTDPSAAFHVAFANTPAQQKLEVRFLGGSRGDAQQVAERAR